MKKKPAKKQSAKPIDVFHSHWFKVFHSHLFEVATLEFKRPRCVSKVEVQRDKKGNLYLTLHDKD